MRETSGYLETERAKAEAWLEQRISEVETELLRQQRRRYAPTIEELQVGIHAAIAQEMAAVTHDIARRLDDFQDATAQLIVRALKPINDRLDRIEAAVAGIERSDGAAAPQPNGLARLRAMKPNSKQDRQPRGTSPRGIDWDAEFAAKPPDESWADMARRLGVGSKTVHAARRTRGVL